MRADSRKPTEKPVMRSRHILAAILLAAMTAPALAEDVVHVTRNGKLYRIDFDGPTIAEVKVINMDNGGGPVTPPPAGGSLTAWTTAAVKAIPAHKYKEETAVGLSSAYLGLAKAYRDERFASPAEFAKERQNIHDRLTGALGTKADWAAFDQKLKVELNRVDPNGKKIPENMEQIASGLTAGQAINPALIQAGIKLVLAMLSRDQAAISAAIGELIVALLGSIGGGSAYVGG